MAKHNTRSLTATLPADSPLHCVLNSWFGSFPACAFCGEECPCDHGNTAASCDSDRGTSIRQLPVRRNT